MLTFDWGFNVVGDDLDTSILASIGGWVAWVSGDVAAGVLMGRIHTFKGQFPIVARGLGWARRPKDLPPCPTSACCRSAWD